MAQGDGNYVNMSEISWPLGWTDEQKGKVIAKWEAHIERVCGDVFYPQERTVLLDGNGQPTLSHGKGNALLAVSSLKVEGQAVSEDDFSFDRWSVHLKSAPEGMATRFPKGYCNIELSGTFGWTSPPEAICAATKILIERELDLLGESSPSPAHADAVEGEKIGDYSYRRDTRGPYLTGVVEVDRLIQPYVRRGPVPQSI